MRIGVVRNPRSHANRLSEDPGPRPPGLAWAEPDAPGDLPVHLKRFASQGVERLIIDGGDGTVREVLGALPAAYGDAWPVLTVVPSGKTNILALDLGAKRGWRLDAALERVGAEDWVPTLRTPIEVSWAGGGRPSVRGFLVGLGAFVKATEMAQEVHRAGAFHGLAIALTLGGAIFGTLCGGPRSPWRRGEALALSLDGGPSHEGERFVVLATTLERLPLGLAPFGRRRPGFKILDVDAPPRSLHTALPRLLSGRGDAWLARRGYRRSDAAELRLVTDQPLVIDGEVFPGGDIRLRRGDPVRFFAP